jgi:ribonuclease HI
MPCTKAESPVCTNLGIYHAILFNDYELTLASQRRLECEPEVNGFTDAKYKKFDSRSDAEAFVASGVISRVSSSSPQSVHLSFIFTKQNTTYATGIFERHSPSKERKASPDIGDESGHDVVYCRGTCKANGGENAVAGIGIWWGPGDSR